MWMAVGDRRFALTLTDTDAVRAFIARLPLSLDMADLNENEKYADLAQPLPALEGRPGTIHAGDVMLYGTRTVVIFYDTFQSSYSYTRLGHIDETTDLRTALGRGSARVSFSRPAANQSPASGE
jgi:hypothetical protein